MCLFESLFTSCHNVNPHQFKLSCRQSCSLSILSFFGSTYSEYFKIFIPTCRPIAAKVGDSVGHISPRLNPYSKCPHQSVRLRTKFSKQFNPISTVENVARLFCTLTLIVLFEKYDIFTSSFVVLVIGDYEMEINKKYP